MPKNMKQVHIFITFGQGNILKATFNYSNINVAFYTFANIRGIFDYVYD